MGKNKNKSVDCNQHLNFKNELSRLCNSQATCEDCPLKELKIGLENKNCIDITKLTQEAIDTLQDWVDNNPKDLEVGDMVSVRNLAYVFADYYEFMEEYGDKYEKLFWRYSELPKVDDIFTISSINKTMWRDDKVAIITRDVPENDEFLEVFMVEVKGLKLAN